MQLEHILFLKSISPMTASYISDLTFRKLLFGIVICLMAGFSTHANDTSATPSPLIPHVTCIDSVCSIYFQGMFNGNTITSDPLPMTTQLKDDTLWQPQRQSEEALQIAGVEAPFGWTIGSDETEVEIFLKPLFENKGDTFALKYMVMQIAGFEHVGRAYQFLAINYKADKLETARLFAPKAGPQSRVTASSADGITLEDRTYNIATDEFTPSYTRYEWYDGATSPMLASPEELDAIYEQNDISSNE